MTSHGIIQPNPALYDLESWRPRHVLGHETGQAFNLLPPELRELYRWEVVAGCLHSIFFSYKNISGKKIKSIFLVRFEEYLRSGEFWREQKSGLIIPVQLSSSLTRPDLSLLHYYFVIMRGRSSLPGVWPCMSRPAASLLAGPVWTLPLQGRETLHQQSGNTQRLSLTAYLTSQSLQYFYINGHL